MAKMVIYRVINQLPDMVELLEITNNSWRMQGEHGHGVRTLPFPKTSRTATIRNWLGAGADDLHANSYI